MRKDTNIEFRCVGDECKEILSFSIVDVNETTRIRCPACSKEYIFNMELLAKFSKFARLIEAVRDARDILGNTNVGMNVQGHSIRVPYRLLLMRLNTFLTLEIGGNKINFRLRVEPLQDEAAG